MHGQFLQCIIRLERKTAAWTNYSTTFVQCLQPSACAIPSKSYEWEVSLLSKFCSLRKLEALLRKTQTNRSLSKDILKHRRKFVN